MIKCFKNIQNDAKAPNENLNNILRKQLETIIQTFTLHKKSIKRFVKDIFVEGHSPIQLNPHTNDKNSILLFYVVYLVGSSNINKLNDNIFQNLLREHLSLYKSEELVVTNEITSQFKKKILENDNYPDILEKGAHIIKQWNN